MGQNLKANRVAKKKKPAKRWPTTLFPLPKNRKRRPTDAETLLHALAIGIRDHATHAQLRELICHLPRICNRMSPYTASAEQNFELQEKVGELEREVAKLRRRKDKPVTDIRQVLMEEQRTGGVLAK